MGVFTAYKDKLIVLVIGLLIGLVCTLGAMLWLQSRVVDSLRIDNTRISGELGVSKANNVVLEGAIIDQNTAIESTRNDYEAKIAEYEEWQAKPAEIKYKTIVKEIKSDECVDIKNALDELSTIKF